MVRASVFLGLLTLGFVGCGDDSSEEACHPVTESIESGSYSCNEFCEQGDFESGEERHDGCTVECECSGGTGSIETEDDCWSFCDAYDIVDPEEWMVVDENTCACDRTEGLEDEQSGGRR